MSFAEPLRELLVVLEDDAEIEFFVVRLLVAEDGVLVKCLLLVVTVRSSAVTIPMEWQVVVVAFS